MQAGKPLHSMSRPLTCIASAALNFERSIMKSLSLSTAAMLDAGARARRAVVCADDHHNHNHRHLAHAVRARLLGACRHQRRTRRSSMTSCTAGFACDDRDHRVCALYAGGRFNNAIGLELGALNIGKYSRGGGETDGWGIDVALVAGIPDRRELRHLRQARRDLRAHRGERRSQSRRRHERQGARHRAALGRRRPVRADQGMGAARRLGPLPHAASRRPARSGHLDARRAVHVPLGKPSPNKKARSRGPFFISAWFPCRSRACAPSDRIS